MSAEGHTVTEIKRKWFDMKMEAKKCIAQAKFSMMTTGGEQEVVAISEVDLRIQEIIGEVAVPCVQSDISSWTQVAADAVLQNPEQILSPLQEISSTLISLISVLNNINQNLERINETLKGKST